MTRLESAVPASGRRPDSTGRRVRLEVQRQTSTWKRITLGIGVLGLAAMGAMFTLTARRNQASEVERNALLSRTDSLLARMQTTSATVTTLTSALADARRETERLRGELADKGVTAARRDSLGAALASSLARHEGVVRAAELDLAALAKGNADAIGLVVSEFADGHRVTGTGFSVRVRGDTGWIATNRHLVADSSGRPATRLGIIFNGSSQNFRAELVGTADSADLGLLRVRVRGGVPMVRSLHGNPHAGDPVAIFGFPFGFDFPVGGDWRQVGVRIAQFSGTIRRVGPDRTELNGYGASGSSGSPVFGADGAVVAVVFGGAPGSAGQLVYAVPVDRLVELLSRLGLTPE
jgi:S1-C subfamily serine protease